eukprot:8695777-Pyramimonas_sp.AAC.1
MFSHVFTRIVRACMHHGCPPRFAGRGTPSPPPQTRGCHRRVVDAGLLVYACTRCGARGLCGVRRRCGERGCR